VFAHTVCSYNCRAKKNDFARYKTKTTQGVDMQKKENDDICPRFFGDFQISIQASKLSTKKKKGKQNKTLHKTINNRFRINQTTLVKFDL